MERTIISNIKNTISSGDYFIDGAFLSDENVEIEIEVNSTCDILLDNLKDIKDLNIVINQNSNVRLSFIAEDEMKARLGGSDRRFIGKISIKEG